MEKTEGWVEAFCMEFAIKAFKTEEEFKKHLKKRHHFPHRHHKKKRDADWSIGNSNL